MFNQCGVRVARAVRARSFHHDLNILMSWIVQGPLELTSDGFTTREWPEIAPILALQQCLQ
eukprot:3067939-Prymnesium_polylepis.1